MRMLFAIAWRNVWRSRLRSFVVLAAVCLGLFGGVFSMAFMNGMSRQRIRSAIETEISDIQIHRPEFLGNGELRYVINDAGACVGAIRRTPSVRAVARRLKVNAMASTAKTGVGVTILGITPAVERTVSDISRQLVEGDYFAADRPNGIVIGEKLARKLGAKMRSKIVLTVQGLDGTIAGGAFRIVGIYKTVNSSFDETMVFARAADVGALTGLDTTVAHEIAVVTGDSRRADATAALLARTLPALDVRPWKKTMPELAMLDGMMNYMMMLFLVIILIALAFGIVNTMLMAILERTRELGMLMAIGMTRLRLFAMIMIETVLLSLTGGLAGMILSEFAIRYFGVHGINLAAVSRGLSSMGYGALVYPYIDPPFYATLGLLIVGAGVVSSLYPAHKALSLKPAEAVRST